MTSVELKDADIWMFYFSTSARFGTVMVLTLQILIYSF